MARPSSLWLKSASVALEDQLGLQNRQRSLGRDNRPARYSIQIIQRSLPVARR